jgi:hypothetical protein
MGRSSSRALRWPAETYKWFCQDLREHRSGERDTPPLRASQYVSPEVHGLRVQDGV